MDLDLGLLCVHPLCASLRLEPPKLLAVLPPRRHPGAPRAAARLRRACSSASLRVAVPDVSLRGVLLPVFPLQIGRAHV